MNVRHSYAMLSLLVTCCNCAADPGSNLSLAHPSPLLKFHAVPIQINSYRLLSMSMDEDGFIWTGSIHHAIHRYHPDTGAITTIAVPKSRVANSCICVGKKVYILGQDYPRLIIYDRATKRFDEVDYPALKPHVWYGTKTSVDHNLYIFDRNNGVIRWDTQVDKGKIISYPYPTAAPGGGRLIQPDKAIWCVAMHPGIFQYRLAGLARLDLATHRFTSWDPKPEQQSDLKPFTDPETTFFVAESLKGRLLPYDFKDKRWCKPIDVPEFGKLFGFIGGPWPHKDRLYFSLSTYNGTETGCDGKPYHFCNSILEFDPQSGKFHFYTLEVKDAYYQLAYMLSAGGEFYVTGTNIRESDGRLNAERAGEVVFWQTRPTAP